MPGYHYDSQTSKGRKRINNLARKICKKHGDPSKYQHVFIGCGASGIATAASLFQLVPNSTWGFIRKRSDSDTHGSHFELEGAFAYSRKKRVWIVDDFVCSGKTVAWMLTEFSRAEHAMTVYGVAVQRGNSRNPDSNYGKEIEWMFNAINDRPGLVYKNQWETGQFIMERGNTK